MRNRFKLADHSIRAKPLVCACALLCLSATASSMDLLQAFEAAKLQDATILASRAGAAAGRERLPQARAQLLPNVSFNLTQNNNKLVSSTPDFLGVAKSTNSDYLSGNQTLSIRQPVFRSYLFAQFRQAKAQVIDSDAALEMDEQNLAVRVSGAYFDAVLSHEQLALVLAQRAAYTTQLDAARKIFAAGAGTRTDVDEAQAKLDMTLAQEIEARQNVDYTLRQLQVMVNQPIDTLASVDVSKLELLSPAPARLEEWTERAEQNSPELRMLRARLDSAREDVNKAQSGHHPTLDAVAQWTRSDSENVTNVNSRYTNTTVGFQLNIPLYAGGYVNSQVRQALAAQDHAEQALEADRRDLAMRVQKEFRGMTENIPKVRALEQAVKSSEQMVLSSKKSYQAGSRTVLDVLNAEQQRMGVLRDLAQARYMYLISKIRLLSLVGSADVTAVSEVNRMLQH